MSNRPCNCDRFRPGEAYDIARDCRLCWLFAHNASYRKQWGGDNAVTTVKPPIFLADRLEAAAKASGVADAADKICERFGAACGCMEREQKVQLLSAWLDNPTREALDKLLE